jgi:hypothetical protein
MNAPPISKLRNGVNKSKCAMNIHCNHLNCCTIVNLKTRRCSKTLKDSQRMGGGRIFQKPSGPLSLMKTYRISLISAGYISLDSTFNVPVTFLNVHLFYVYPSRLKSHHTRVVASIHLLCQAHCQRVSIYPALNLHF